MQEVVNVRIDVRLIHGQVAAMWINTLHVTRMIVVDEIAAKDKIMREVLRMACPPAVKLSILPPQVAATNLLANKYDGDRIMMVAKNPKGFLDLVDAGYMLKEINVGNMASGLDTKRIKKSVHCSPNDIEHFLKLKEKGVDFTAQMYPGEERFDFIEAIKKA